MEVDRGQVGRRLRQARMRKGWSQRDLHQATRVAQAKIHRLEAGTATRSTLAEFDALAAALDTTVDRLLYPSPVEARMRAHYRRPRNADESTARARAVDLLDLDEALDSVGHTRPHRPGGLPLLPESFEAEGDPRVVGRELAEHVRDLLGLGVSPIADMVELLEDLLGLDVDISELAEVSGMCVLDEERGRRLLLINSSESAARQRFTMGHELAHLLLGDKMGPDDDESSSPHESLCNEFARHLLIPLGGVEGWWTRFGDPEVDERGVALLARHFDVSPEVARIQVGLVRDVPDLLKTPLARDAADVLAERFGWAEQLRAENRAASETQPPRALAERALAAYVNGKLGLAALARLQRRPAATIEASLEAHGIVPKATPGRRRSGLEQLLATTAG